MKFLSLVFLLLSFHTIAGEICSIDRKALHEDDFVSLLFDGFECFEQKQAPLTFESCKLYVQSRNRSAVIRLEIYGKTEWSGVYAKKVMWLPTLSSMTGTSILPPHVLHEYEEGWKDAFDLLKTAVENGECE